MNEEAIKNVSGFHDLLNEFKGKGKFVYRGQPDDTWPVSCSAVRRLLNYSTDTVEDFCIDYILIGYLKVLIDKAELRGFVPTEKNEPLTDLELLAKFQHQGAATGLLDFTRQPLVALWFACNEHSEKNGAIYVLPVSNTTEIKNPRVLHKKIASFYEGHKLWMWEPSALGNRIVSQSSVLIFGVPFIPPSKMTKIIVSANSKGDILDQLDNSYGISEDVLFSDFSGYAIANAYNKTFDVERTIGYWEEQITLAPDEEEEAKSQLYCGVVYLAIKKLKKSIHHFDNALNLGLRHHLTYCMRGKARYELKDYKDAINDFTEALNIDSQFLPAYFLRGTAKVQLNDIKEGRKDFELALNIAESTNNTEFALGMRDVLKKLDDYDDNHTGS